MAGLVIPAWRPTSREYHASGGWSSSRLRLFRTDPRSAYRRFVAGTEDPPEPTASMRLGSAVHALLRAAADGTPAGVERSEHGPTSARFRARARLDPDRILLSGPEYSTAVAMVGAILEPIRGTAERPTCAEVARSLLVEAPGVWEWAHRWTEAGIALRSMCDRAVQLAAVTTLVELKTWTPRHGDSSPQAFAAEVVRYGYAEQAELYRRGYLAATGERPDHVLVAITTTPPHEVLVRRVVAPPGEDPWPWELQAARVVDETLERLALALAEPGGTAWRKDHETLPGWTAPGLDMPRWAAR